MFGIKLCVFKNKKNDVIKKVLSEDEVLAIKEHYKNIKQKNIELIKEEICSFVEKKVKEFILENPQPFNIGDVITYDYYDSKDLKSKDFSSSIGWASYEFKDIKELKGPFTAPVHKIFVENNLFDEIYEKLLQSFDFSETLEVKKKTVQNKEGYNINQKEFSKTLILNLIDNVYRDKLDFYKKNNKDLFRWFVDFNWEELKLPYNDSEGKGWLNLRWGGFNAERFILSSSKIAKEQIKTWKKELKLNIQKEKMERKIEIQMKKLSLLKEKIKNYS